MCFFCSVYSVSAEVLGRGGHCSLPQDQTGKRKISVCWESHDANPGEEIFEDLYTYPNLSNATLSDYCLHLDFLNILFVLRVWIRTCANWLNSWVWNEGLWICRVKDGLSWSHIRAACSSWLCLMITRTKMSFFIFQPSVSK